jgi:nucleoside-diphosphate-sugar epimerase
MSASLITGGMGFLGTYLARLLLNRGDEVVLFQRRNVLPPSAADLEGRVEICSGDISNWVHVLEALQKYRVDSVYHTAALLSKECGESAASGFRVNVVGTVNILEAARILGIKDIIYTSSASTYGVKSVPEVVYNDTPQNAESMYATTKMCSERLGEQYFRQYGINFRGVRYAMVVGPTRQISYYYGDWSGIIERVAQGKPYVVHSNPEISCAYIYIKDAVRAMIDLQGVEEGKLRQRIYNIHGFNATLSQVAEAIREVIPDAEITFEQDNSKAMEAANSGVNYRVDDTVAFEDLGYKARYHLAEMVEDFVKEIRAGRVNK